MHFFHFLLFLGGGGGGWGGDDDVPCICIHGRCYASHGVGGVGGGVGMMTFLALAHMVDATQVMGWGGVKFFQIERKITSVVHSHPPSHYVRTHVSCPQHDD